MTKLKRTTTTIGFVIVIGVLAYAGLSARKTMGGNGTCTVYLDTTCVTSDCYIIPTDFLCSYDGETQKCKCNKPFLPVEW